MGSVEASLQIRAILALSRSRCSLYFASRFPKKEAGAASKTWEKEKKKKNTRPEFARGARNAGRDQVRDTLRDDLRGCMSRKGDQKHRITYDQLYRRKSQRGGGIFTSAGRLELFVSSTQTRHGVEPCLYRSSVAPPCPRRRLLLLLRWCSGVSIAREIHAVFLPVLTASSTYSLGPVSFPLGPRPTTTTTTSSSNRLVA